MIFCHLPKAVLLILVQRCMPQLVACVEMSSLVENESIDLFIELLLGTGFLCHGSRLELDHLLGQGGGVSEL